MSKLVNRAGTVEASREAIGNIFRRVGIPTLFEGVQYRSRIEATWAAFLSLVKLDHEYEPTDLPGWIPDFKLNFAKHPIIVEVKATEDDFELAKSKIECAGWDGEVAILVNAESSIVGEIYDPDLGWDRAALVWCSPCKKPTLMSESGRWRCRTCGGGQGCLWFGWKPLRDWRAAKNVTQWRKPT
jgi:hypothetical protein